MKTQNKRFAFDKCLDLGIVPVLQTHKKTKPVKKKLPSKNIIQHLHKNCKKQTNKFTSSYCTYTQVAICTGPLFCSPPLHKYPKTIGHVHRGLHVHAHTELQRDVRGYIAHIQRGDRLQTVVVE